METGFFTMPDANKVLTLRLDLAKLYCLGKVDAFVHEHPGTHETNIVKAKRMVMRARSSHELAIHISNFILAHTSENLSVLK